MNKGKKKQKQKQEQRREYTKVNPPDQDILDSIGDSNVWTPKIETRWLNELGKISSAEIYRRFPPMKKPGNVSRRGKNCGG